MFFDIISLIIGFLAGSLFLFLNPHRRFKYLIFVFALGLIFTPTVFSYFPTPLVGRLIWGVSAIGLLVFYTLRFISRPEKTLFDYSKFLVVMLLVAYPFTITSFPERDGFLLALIGNMTFYLAGTILLYDRFIMKPQLMNRKLITILGAQTLMIGALWAYGYVQQNAAARDADEANRQKQISKQLQFEKQVLERELKNCR